MMVTFMKFDYTKYVVYQAILITVIMLVKCNCSFLLLAKTLNFNVFVYLQ